MEAETIVGNSVVIQPLRLRCSNCNRLLAEKITPPYRIRCRCKTVNEDGLGAELVLSVRQRRE